MPWAWAPHRRVMKDRAMERRRSAGARLAAPSAEAPILIFVSLPEERPRFVTFSLRDFGNLPFG